MQARSAFTQQALEVAHFARAYVSVTVLYNDDTPSETGAPNDGEQEPSLATEQAFMRAMNALIEKAIDVAVFPGTQVTVNVLYRDKHYQWATPTTAVPTE